MKNFVKALKLYLKVIFNPITTVLGVFIMAVLLIMAAVSPETPDSEDYMSMLGSVGFGQFGIAVFCLMGSVSGLRYKYYAALPFAKTLVTVVPVACAATASLIYDCIAITIAAFCWCEQALSDILIIAPINSFIICLAVACVGKPKLEIFYLIPMFVMAMETVVLPHVGLTAHGFGLPVVISGFIGILIFIFGVALTLTIMDLWWKKCDHIYRRSYNASLNRI